MKFRFAAVFIGAVVVVGCMVLNSSLYVVEEGQQAIVTQFGRPIEAVQDAGLHFKSPFVQKVHYLEKRLLPWDGSPESMQTRDKKRIDIIVWARWQITDPMTFFIKVRTEQRGQNILDNLVDSTVRDVVATHKLIDVVRRSNKELVYEEDEEEEDEDNTRERSAPELVTGNGRDDVEAEILGGVNLKKYGMKLIKVRIKRVNYIESVRQDVYKRMSSERQVIVKKIDANAQKSKKVIEGEMIEELAAIEGDREQKSAQIRGEADARVIEMTAKAYGQSAESIEFYEFLRRLEIFKKTLGSDTRLILSTESDLFRLLKNLD